MSDSAHRRRACLSIGLKLAYSVFVAVLVVEYWAYRGPTQFLWMSDIALLLTLIALWLEHRLLASMMAVAVLLPECVWNVDFLLHLVAGRDVLGFKATAYMWDGAIPPHIRGLSLFHVFLPVVLIYLIARLGYDPRALRLQTLLAWIVLPASYLLTGPEQNVNWTYGIGSAPQGWMPPPMYLIVLMILVPVVIYLPTHYILRRVFRAKARL